MSRKRFLSGTDYCVYCASDNTCYGNSDKCSGESHKYFFNKYETKRGNVDGSQSWSCPVGTSSEGKPIGKLSVDRCENINFETSQVKPIHMDSQYLTVFAK